MFGENYQVQIHGFDSHYRWAFFKLIRKEDSLEIFHVGIFLSSLWICWKAQIQGQAF